MPDGVLPARFYRPVVIVLTLAYLAGVVGLQVASSAPLFRQLVPFNLLASLALLLLFHSDWRPSFLFYCGLAFTLGFLIEVLGVQTGYVFGDYAYGPTLGWGLWDVPLIIGVNWLMLSYCCGVICDRPALPVYLKTILAASLMVLLDILIEPVAIRLDFWTWFGADIPLRNYLGWWIVSLVILAIWYGLPFRKENPLARPLLLLQFLFFIASNLAFFLTAE
ncbi:carotenoid biosynthesis protein [Larkinella soli]|uniref:carotenoid biosynthesis protein n=1 Tax=Larkinella soli TaxID=1770527 RepID=UPI000FFC478A|nr:carotenoid biosynthesis protein [Larkinella soli]